MTDEEIDAMSAGQEMDILIAEKVMGFEIVEAGTKSPIYLGGTEKYLHCRPLPRYSTDIAAAWEVIAKCRWATIFMAGKHHAVSLNGYMANAETLPLAVCRAALKAAFHA